MGRGKLRSGWTSVFSFLFIHGHSEMPVPDLALKAEGRARIFTAGYLPFWQFAL